jgi:hypothetical protein
VRAAAASVAVATQTSLIAPQTLQEALEAAEGLNKAFSSSQYTEHAYAIKEVSGRRMAHVCG